MVKLLRASSRQFGVPGTRRLAQKFRQRNSAAPYNTGRDAGETILARLQTG